MYRSGRQTALSFFLIIQHLIAGVMNKKTEDKEMRYRSYNQYYKYGDKKIFPDQFY
jgi:hypothetical protein